jgi:molybdopterin molybdotransferase
VVQTVRERAVVPEAESVRLDQAAGRVLAESVAADRDYPPLPRSIRDGFAVRAADFPAGATVVGEVRAGERFSRTLRPGEAVEIMTGAPVPEGADAVIMVEHVARDNNRITADRTVSAGDFIVPAGAECRAGHTAVEAGTRLGFAQVAALASVGAAEVRVYRRPRVAVLATGDELVPVDATPDAHRIRNSNSWTLAARVRTRRAACGARHLRGDTQPD